jgi:hypothetical protein
MAEKELVLRRISHCMVDEVYELKITDEVLQRWNSYIDYEASGVKGDLITRETIKMAMTSNDGVLDEEYEERRPYNVQHLVTKHEELEKEWLYLPHTGSLFDLIYAIYEAEIYDNWFYTGSSEEDWSEDEAEEREEVGNG